MNKLDKQWSLNDFYFSFDDPQFISDYETAIERAKSFNKTYKGKIKTIVFEPQKIAECLREYEELLKSFYRLQSFPALKFSADTRDKDAQKWQNLAMEKVSLAENEIIFISLEIQKLPRKMIKALMHEDVLSPYIHYLQRLLDFKKHTLDEDIEKVLNESLVTGRSAFIQLRELHLGAQEFEPVTPPGGEPIDTEAGLSALLFHPDPDVRLSAYRSVRKVYEKNNLLYGYILQKVAQDHKMDTARRNYKSTLEKQLLVDEVSLKAYRTVIDVTRDAFDLFQDYYRFKGKALHMEKVRICDLYAPFEPIDMNKSYEECAEMIYSAMSQVDDEFVSIVRKFFENRYIDAEIRKGKQGGAFCWSIWGFHPYILISYTGDPESLFTTAHELGHGIHAILAHRNQRLLGSNPPMVLAEIASIFSELLLLDHLLTNESDPKIKKALIVRQLEDALNMLFRQTTISRLEEDIHEQAKKGTFDADWVDERWDEWYRTLGGESVEILPEHKFDWARIGHIYFKPFYCYNYCLSYMVSLACYIRYLDEGKSFVPKFKELLSFGGSKSPIDALKSVGINPEDKKVMKGAIEYSRKMLMELKKLA